MLYRSHWGSKVMPSHLPVKGWVIRRCFPSVVYFCCVYFQSANNIIQLLFFTIFTDKNVCLKKKKLLFWSSVCLELSFTESTHYCGRGHFSMMYSNDGHVCTINVAARGNSTPTMRLFPQQSISRIVGNNRRDWLPHQSDYANSSQPNVTSSLRLHLSRSPQGNVAAVIEIADI